MYRPSCRFCATTVRSRFFSFLFIVGAGMDALFSDNGHINCLSLIFARCPRCKERNQRHERLAGRFLPCRLQRSSPASRAAITGITVLRRAAARVVPVRVVRDDLEAQAPGLAPVRVRAAVPAILGNPMRQLFGVAFFTCSPVLLRPAMSERTACAEKKCRWPRIPKCCVA